MPVPDTTPKKKFDLFGPEPASGTALPPAASSATASTNPFYGGYLSSPAFLTNFSAPHSGPQMGMDLQHSVRKQSHVLGCGLWHKKPTFVASCGLMCLQKNTTLVVALHACFPCKKSHPDPRTTRNFCHFRQGFKQNSKVRRLGRILQPPNTGSIWSQSEASSSKTSNTIPQYWDGV